MTSEVPYSHLCIVLSLNRVATVYCSEDMYPSIPITAVRYLKQLAADRITR